MEGMPNVGDPKRKPFAQVLVKTLVEAVEMFTLEFESRLETVINETLQHKHLYQRVKVDTSDLIDTIQKRILNVEAASKFKAAAYSQLQHVVIDLSQKPTV